MSGPKSADYYLTPEQRRQLAEQRRINELKKKIEKYSSCAVYSQAEMEEYASHAEEALKLASDDNGHAELQREFSAIIKELSAELESAENLSSFPALGECFDSIKRLKAKKEQSLRN